LIRVVADTNIVVSAALSPLGKSAQILDMIFDRKIQVYYNAAILAEYEDVLSRPRFNFSSDKKIHFIEGIKRVGVLTETSISDVSLPDESDRVFYDTAKARGAILITGNVRHYPNDAFILTPAEFILMLGCK